MALTVFDKIDSRKRTFFGFNPFAILWNINHWRKYFSLCVIVASVAWIVLGFDSCWSQLKPFIENFIPLILGNVSFRELWLQSRFYYGKGNHFSAPVIYGISWIYLSKYLERIGIKGSLNFCSTTGMSLMNIGIFELMWNFFYAYFQGQTWVITFKWKQITNLVSFIVFVILGGLCLLYLHLGDYKINFSRRTKFLLLLTIGCWIFWIHYPLQVDHITVETTEGLWTNSRLFPQTYFCVDVNPNDGIAIGEPNWIENDYIHFTNTFTKVIQTLLLLSLCMVEAKGNAKEKT